MVKPSLPLVRLALTCSRVFFVSLLLLLTFYLFFCLCLTQSDISGWWPCIVIFITVRFRAFIVFSQADVFSRDDDPKLTSLDFSLNPSDGRDSQNHFASTLEIFSPFICTVGDFWRFCLPLCYSSFHSIALIQSIMLVYANLFHPLSLHLSPPPSPLFHQFISLIPFFDLCLNWSFPIKHPLLFANSINENGTDMPQHIGLKLFEIDVFIS